MGVLDAGDAAEDARVANDLIDAALADLTPPREPARLAQTRPRIDAPIGRKAFRLEPPVPSSGITPRPASRAATSKPPARTSRPARGALLACVAGLAVFLIADPFARHGSPSRPPASPEAALTRPSAPASKAIEEVAIFDRLAGTNPALSDADRRVPEPDPATWRVLRLHMTKEGGGLLHIKLARPLSWIELVGAEPGKAIFLDLPEMGAVGRAEVLAIDACPPLRPGKGSVVTGTFAHEAGANLVTVQLSGGIEPIGVTDNHPFWSEERGDFVPVGRLKQGERVRTRIGTAQVVAISKRPSGPGQMVYNLEVHGEHVYQVTAAGVLVHNSCPGTAYHGTDVESALNLLNGGKLKAASAAARKIDGPAGFFLATHLDDAAFFAGRRSGTILEFRFTDAARRELNAAGVLRRPIPGGPKSPRFLGDELHIQPDQFDLFNRLLDSGDIRIFPANF